MGLKEGVQNYDNQLFNHYNDPTLTIIFTIAPNNAAITI